MAEVPGNDEFRERLHERGIARELSSEEFADLVDGAEPRTDDDRPWTFPVKVRMTRSPRPG